MRRRSPPDPESTYPPPPPPPTAAPAPPSTSQRVASNGHPQSPATIENVATISPPSAPPVTSLLESSPSKEKAPPKPIVIRPPIPPQHVYAPMPTLGALSFLGRKKGKKEMEDYTLITNGIINLSIHSFRLIHIQWYSIVIIRWAKERETPPPLFILHVRVCNGGKGSFLCQQKQKMFYSFRNLIIVQLRRGFFALDSPFGSLLSKQPCFRSLLQFHTYFPQRMLKRGNYLILHPCHVLQKKWKLMVVVVLIF